MTWDVIQSRSTKSLRAANPGAGGRGLSEARCEGKKRFCLMGAPFMENVGVSACGSCVASFSTLASHWPMTQTVKV